MHQIQTTVVAIDAALSQAADANPIFLSTTDKAAALLALTRLEARIAELRLRVMAASQDVAEEIGARDVASWLVAQEVVDSRAAHAALALARGLEQRPLVRAGLAAGRFSLEHARVILDGITALPEDLPTDVVERAEAHLCDLAGQHRPKDLRHLAHHLLEVVAPEIAEAAEADAIRRLEETAHAKATLSISDHGDGMTRIHAIVPEAVGERLRTLLEAFAQPRVAALEADGKVRPRNRLFADAFAQVLECVPGDGVPAHGGDATAVIVTIPIEYLHSELGIAQLGDTKVPAGEARRLACTAAIIPYVLGGISEPLDLGRARRLFSPAQHKALKVRDRHCRAEGCTVPATWCDAHHDNPWSRGGPTDLTNAALLCGHHHRKAHDTTYETIRLANGDYRYRRKIKTPLRDLRGLAS
ncbi:HNH endonuclease signature motif containing protein [Nocardioides sp. Iso805N]|uniref:HNH endonuclease signature motif containing protein n=1 Tax=Nocardioides sp. Iso805N TaxID=1283287 RepID=UPI001E5E8EAE|nr:HNH endonuclease signature motif containing protein [Nocardioides sp. Iso805N]